jgi:hypothetical protein
MNDVVDDEEYGVPDDENPEWTEETFRWSVKAADFGGNIRKVHDFLIRRTEILRAADALGIPREVFLPFEPTKPGFEERLSASFGLFPKAAGLAAE